MKFIFTYLKVKHLYLTYLVVCKIEFLCVKRYFTSNIICAGKTSNSNIYSFRQHQLQSIKYYLCRQNFQFKYILVQAAAAAMDPGGLNGGAGLGGGIPESTRYPWMSITGRSRICICICICNTYYVYVYIYVCSYMYMYLYLVPESTRYPWMSGWRGSVSVFVFIC